MKKLVLTMVVAMSMAGCGIIPGFGDSDKELTDVMTSGSNETVKIAVAWSSDGDAAKAATKATETALAAVDGKAKAVVFYTYYQDPSFVPDEASQATACKADIASENAAAKAVNDTCDGVPNIGCRARPLCNGGTLLKNAIAVMAVAGEKASAVAMKTEIQDNRLATGKAIAAAMTNVKDLKLVIALAEMRLSFETKEGVSVEDFIKGVLDNSPKGTTLFGGNSMPDKMPAELHGKQFFNGEALKGHVVALGLGGPLASFGNHANEFKPSAKTAKVTKTSGKWVVTLDGKPAETVYRELSGMKAEDQLTDDWMHPIGVSLGDGKNYTRMILAWVKGGKIFKGSTKPEEAEATDVPDGSLMFVAPVVEGTEVFCLACQQQPGPIVASAADTVAESVAAAKTAGAEPSVLLLSNCCARGMRLRTFGGFGTNDEIDLAVAPALGGNVPIFGFYAWGELGRIKGEYQGMDHQYQQHTFVSNLVGIK